MKQGLKIFLAGTVGLIAGGSCGFFVGKRYQMKLDDEFMEEILNDYSDLNKRLVDLESERDSIRNSQEMVEKNSKEKDDIMKNIINDYSGQNEEVSEYFTSEDEEDQEELEGVFLEESAPEMVLKKDDGPYLIDPSNPTPDTYNYEVYTVYKNKIVTDIYGEVVPDGFSKIGDYNFENGFGEYSDYCMWLRDDDAMTDYEIQLEDYDYEETL